MSCVICIMKFLKHRFSIEKLNFATVWEKLLSLRTVEMLEVTKEVQKFKKPNWS